MKGQDSVAQFVVVVVLMWLILAFGGSIVPAATGIMLSVVPNSAKNLASGFGQGIYNIFGFALGSQIPGLVMKAAPEEYNQRDTMRLGVRGKCGKTIVLGGKTKAV